MSTQPLENIVIADFSHVMAGPYASHLLRLLGARVIKIEEPVRGDPMRYYGTDRRYDGMAPAFIAVNAGKESIGLNLKDEGDRRVAERIVRHSDVLLENFRPGVIGRLGFGYEQVKELAHDIVYCSVSGYGQSGERRDWPAIDNIVQATSGMMSLGGEPDDPPMRVGFPVVDTLTGQTAAFAILAALFRRARTGQGEFIDVAMFDASLAFMASAVVPYLVTGKGLERTGNTGYSGQPTAGMFEARDGHLISLGVVQQSQFDTLRDVLGRQEWLDDPRFASPQSRREHFAAVHAALADVLKTQGAAEWESDLSAAGIPCGMVRNVAEAAEMLRNDASNGTLKLKIEGLPEREDVDIVNAGFRMLGGGPSVEDAPPRLDEHRADVLAWLERADAQ